MIIKRILPAVTGTGAGTGGRRERARHVRHALIVCMGVLAAASNPSLANAEKAFKPKPALNAGTDYWDRKEACLDEVAKAHYPTLSDAPNRIEFWIRAFIPFSNPSTQKFDVPGETDPKHATISVVGNPGLGEKSYSASDQREFEQIPRTTSRVTLRLVFDTTALELVSYDAWSDCTYHIHPTTKKVDGDGQGNPKPDVTNEKTGQVLRGTFEVHESQPILKLSVLGPIRIKGKFTVSGDNRTLIFEPWVSRFPAFEFLVVKGGKMTSLKNLRPEPSATVKSLVWPPYPPVKVDLPPVPFP